MLDTEIEELIRAEERRQTEGLEMIPRSEEHTSELQSQSNLVCRLLLEKKKIRDFEPVDRPGTRLDLPPLGKRLPSDHPVSILRLALWLARPRTARARELHVHPRRPVPR